MSRKITIQNVPIVIRRLTTNPGRNTVTALFTNKSAEFEVTTDGATLKTGNIDPDMLPILRDHIAVHHRPLPKKRNMLYEKD